MNSNNLRLFTPDGTEIETIGGFAFYDSAIRKALEVGATSRVPILVYNTHPHLQRCVAIVFDGDVFEKTIRDFLA